MESKVEEINSVQRRLRVAITPENVDKVFNETLREVQKNAAVKGFRKGKVPLPMLKKMYGSSIAAEVAEKLVRENLFKAITSTGLRPIASPALEEVKLPKEGEQFSFSAVVDVIPSFNLGNYKKLKLHVHEHSVAEGDVDSEVQRLQRQYAKTRALPADTVARNAHAAVVKQEFWQGETYLSDLTHTDLQVQIGEEGEFHEIDTQLVGMKVGDSKDFDFTVPQMPEGSKMHAHQGETLKCRIELKDLHELVLPELNDEFAKDLGLESLAGLRTRIQETLNGMHKQSFHRECEAQLIEQLVKSHDFEVPPALVDSVIDQMINQYQWKNDKDREGALRNPDLRARFLDAGKQKAKAALILREIVRAENLDVSDDDINNYLENMLAQNNVSPDQRLKLVAQLRQSFEAKARDEISLGKAIDRLIELADFDCDHEHHDHAHEKEHRPKK